MQDTSAPATVTEGRRAPAESYLCLPSAVKGILTSSVSHICHKTHRKKCEVARVSRVTPCPLAMSMIICLLLRNKPRCLVATGEMRAGTKEGSSVKCWGLTGFPRPEVSQETGRGMSSQVTMARRWLGLHRKARGSWGGCGGCRLGRRTPARAGCCGTRRKNCRLWVTSLPLHWASCFTRKS